MLLSTMSSTLAASLLSLFALYGGMTLGVRIRLKSRSQGHRGEDLYLHSGLGDPKPNGARVYRVAEPPRLF
jgi:hypothetical protein